MRSLAAFVLAAASLAQLLLLGASAAFLVLRLRSIEAEITKLGNQEEALLDVLTTAEGELYRASILVRDGLASSPAEWEKVRVELGVLLERMEDSHLAVPPGTPRDLARRLRVIGTARQEYLAQARAIASWTEAQRLESGRAYLSTHLSPARQRFGEAVSEITSVVRILRGNRARAAATSAAVVQGLVVRVLAGAAVLGLVLTAAALWNFRQYERDRDGQMNALVEAEDQLRALSQRLVEAQEQERKRLSRELHDEVGQVLTALRVQLGQVTPKDADSERILQQSATLVDRSLQTVRQMARGLRPAMLDDLGLGPALVWLGREVSSNTSLDVEVIIEGEFAGLDEARSTCVYRVVQEALTNCVKHSGATHARVVLHESPGEIVLSIQDNGSGAKAAEGQGIGLVGMRERIEELGGEFAVRSAPGAGFLIRANLPGTGGEKRDSSADRG